MSERCLIVGAGPVGLTLANLLSQYGVSCRIIDRGPGPVLQTKAAGLWARTLEMLHHMDLDQQFLEVAHRSYSAHLYQGGSERLHLDLAKLPSSYNFITLIPQHVTEGILEHHLRQRHGVVVERGVSLVSLREHRATIAQGDGTPKSEEYRFIFGTDGAHSRVRKECGVSFAGTQLEGFWNVGDVHARSEMLPRNEVSIFLSEEGPIAFFALGHDRYRVVARCDQHLDPVPLEFFQEAVNTRMPFPVRLSDGHCMTGFSIHERQAERYRHGCTFLLGDAAHIHSPAGGQGLNTGMQDAFNLAWKVAQVIHWGSPESLLESYHLERHPVARRVMEASGAAIRAASITNPVTRTLQGAAIELAGSLAPVQKRIRNALSELDVHYGDSPLNAARSSKTLSPGSRLPEVYWRDVASRSHRLHDLLSGLHWTLISRGTAPPLEEIDGARLRSVVISRLESPRGGGLSDPEGMVFRACGLEEGSHLLVRPDGYVAGYFAHGEEDGIRRYWAKQGFGGRTLSACVTL